MSEQSVIKQPIKRLEIQISNFNVAIPHHVNLLQQHKNNIKKYQGHKDWMNVRKEHANVSRIVKQLKELLYQMDTLRTQVLDGDIEQFDKLTANARLSIMNEIKEYLVMQLDFSSPPPLVPIATLEKTKDLEENRILQLQKEQMDFEDQQTCLHMWNSLQQDILQLHELFVEFDEIVHDQKEMVVRTEENIEETQLNVSKGEKFLEKVSRYKVATYPIAGAMLGTCIGGPVGLLAGLKIGSLAALGCGILGFTGGSLLKKKRIAQTCVNESAVDINKASNVQKSASCPENLEADEEQL